jgi:hypothetical protein
MAYTLRNEKDPELSLSINGQTWNALLDLAEDYGWNPVGTMLPEWHAWAGAGEGDEPEELDLFLGSYTPERSRLVVLEDALNLGEALGRAFLDFESCRVHSYPELALMGAAELPGICRPSVGAIVAAAGFCQQGAFWIDWR